MSFAINPHPHCARMLSKERRPLVCLTFAMSAPAQAAQVFLVQLKSAGDNAHGHVLLHGLLEQQTGQPVLEHPKPPSMTDLTAAGRKAPALLALR